MPKRGDIEARQADEVLAEFGRENLEALNDVYQAFVAKVDMRALLEWKIRDPLDDLLLPLFRAALVAIIKDLRLGELGGPAAPAKGTTEWSWRFRSTDGPGTFDGPVVSEVDARAFIRGANSGSDASRVAVVLTRTVGDWAEVPDA